MQKYKYIFTFKKTGLLVFISHLDLMRLFERAFARSGLPVSYSEGFNPHMRLSLPFPLPVGVEGKREYGEIYLAAPIHAEQFLSAVNEFLPPEIQLLSATRTENKESLHNYLHMYEYRLVFSAENGVDTDKVQALLEQPTIPYVKETKRGATDDDMKRYVLSYHLLSDSLVLALVEHDQKALRIDAALKILGLNNLQITDIVREAIHLTL